MGREAFGLEGRRALVVGGASGMGAAAARICLDLGAEVVVMDYADIDLPGVKAIRLDLRDKASIDAAVDECGGPVHALLSCAGVADGTPGIERVNFVGQRHLVERMVGEGMVPPGSAVAMISSAAGMGWEADLPELLELLATPDFDSAVAWFEANPHRANYLWAKEAVCTYVARQALEFIRRGVRINAILPGPTDTPLARANADMWLSFGQSYRDAAGLEVSTPEDQAYPLVFLCTDAARHVNGVNMIVDAGLTAAGVTDAFDEPMIKGLLRR